MQRVHDNGHVYKGLYEGWYCPKCADFKTEAEIGEGNTCPIHVGIAARPRARGELVLPPVQRSSSRSRTSTPSGPTSSPRGPATTRRSRSSTAACRTSRSRARSSPGASRCPWDPAHVFYVWFDALLNYYTALVVRPRRRGPDRALLARQLPHPRQGHPQVPRRVLAGDADGRRAPAARARADPRLPADARRLGRREQDVQVARQRARPVRGDGRVRHRRAALLLLPRGLLRPGRRRLDDHVRRALRVRAGQRLRQPRQPHAGDDRPLPRRRRAGRRRRPGARRPTSTASSRRSPSCSTAPRSPRRWSASGSACGG